MNTVIFREGSQVILRPLERVDLPLLRKWVNDPEVTQFLLRTSPVTEKEEEEWLDGLSKRKTDVVLGIVTKEDQKLIGNIGLHNIDHLHGHAVTGTLIGEKEYWGKGHGTEAKMLLLDFAFNRLNLRRILSEVIAFNGRSLAYSKKCGYVEVARLPGWLYRDGEWHDEVMLMVTAERWRPLWDAYQKSKKTP